MDDPARRARFEQLAREVWAPLHAYVARRAPRDDVDDIVSDVLMVVWRRLEDLPAGAELPWCYATARRTLANHRRSVARRTGLFDRVVRRTRPADLATSSEFDVPSGDPRLDEILAQLPSDDVELLRLWAWEQLEPREIAVVLDISANTASARLSRLRHRLQKMSADGHDPGPAGHKLGADQAEPTR